MELEEKADAKATSHSSRRESTLISALWGFVGEKWDRKGKLGHNISVCPKSPSFRNATETPLLGTALLRRETVESLIFSTESIMLSL